MSERAIDILSNYDTTHKVYCKCGSGRVFYHNGNDRLICKNCGNFIYRNEKAKLKYKMKEKGIMK